MQDIPRKPRGFYDKEKFFEARLAEFIEGRRRRLGKKQAELGEVIGISQQAFGKRVKPEEGKCNLTCIQLVKLFDALEVTDEERIALMKM